MRKSIDSFVLELLGLLNQISLKFDYQLVLYFNILYSTLIYIHITYNSYNIIYITSNYNNFSFNSFNCNNFNLLQIFKTLYNWDTFKLIILLLVLLFLHHLNSIKIKY